MNEGLGAIPREAFKETPWRGWRGSKLSGTEGNGFCLVPPPCGAYVAFSYIFLALTSVTGSEYKCLLLSHLFPGDPLPLLWRMTVGRIRDSNQGKDRSGEISPCQKVRSSHRRGRESRQVLGVEWGTLCTVELSSEGAPRIGVWYCLLCFVLLLFQDRVSL